MKSRVTIASFIGLLTALSPATAQRSTPVTVHGIAYDSLHARPLPGAFVALTGTPRTAMSDSVGRFVFDSVSPGTYRLVMQHDVLDSIGMSGVAARAVVTDGRDTVRVAVPSFSTMWRAACPSNSPPADSGLVFGTIHPPKAVRLPATLKVNASWIDVGFDKSSGVTQHRWRLEAATDSLGNYALCGIPVTTGVRLWAIADTSALAGPIDMLPLDKSRVARRDLLLGVVTTSGDSSATGTIEGVVTGEGGKPLRDAAVVSEGGNEVRTNAEGRFTVRRVPIGTQQLEARAIGLTPVFKTVDVIKGDTAHVTIELVKVTVLDSVKVTANSIRQRMKTDFEDRRKAGFGKFADSTSIGKHPSINAVFGEFPSVILNTRRGAATQILLPAGAGKCLANLFIDQRKTDQRDLADYRPEDIAAIEIYLRPLDVPADLMSAFQMNGGVGSMRCGVIAIWTKRIWP